MLTSDARFNRSCSQALTNFWHLSSTWPTRMCNIIAIMFDPMGARMAVAGTAQREASSACVVLVYTDSISGSSCYRDRREHCCRRSYWFGPIGSVVQSWSWRPFHQPGVDRQWSATQVTFPHDTSLLQNIWVVQTGLESVVNFTYEIVSLQYGVMFSAWRTWHCRLLLHSCYNHLLGLVCPRFVALSRSGSEILYCSKNPPLPFEPP